MTTHNPGLRPTQFNLIGRPPRAVTTDADKRYLAQLDIRSLRALARTNPAVANEVQLSLRAFKRALDGDRVRPGELMGRDDWPTEPMPFQERETFPPFLAPGTADHDLYREAVERLDAGCMTEGLIAQMDSHDPPDVQAARAASEPTPSLHDTITAAASLHVED